MCVSVCVSVCATNEGKRDRERETGQGEMFVLCLAAPSVAHERDEREAAVSEPQDGVGGRESPARERKT